MHLTIKSFEEHDREKLRKLYLDVRKTNFVWLNGDVPLSDSFDTDTQGESILVAWMGDCIVGFVSMWLPDNFVHHLYVDTAWQNRGVGTQLLNAVMLNDNSTFSLKCVKSNTAAIRFYIKYGWVARHQGITDNVPYVFLEYSKNQ